MTTKIIIAGIVVLASFPLVLTGSASCPYAHKHALRQADKVEQMDKLKKGAALE